MEKLRIVYLLKQHRKGLLTKEEGLELLDIVRKDPEGSLVVEAMMEDAESEVFQYTGNTARWTEMVEKIVTIESTIAEQKFLGSRKPIHFLRRWGRVAVAAVVLLIAGGTYFIISRKNEKPIIAASPQKQDVPAPSAIRATITLANGQKVYLDTTNDGQLALQDNVKVVKLADGQIAYRGKSDLVTYNTLTNPRGSKVIDLTLADGTKVWLNAGSSLTYPVAFVGNERKLSISGEGYFEVAHNASRPFIVTKGDAEIKVLGTHFNVNTYEDEDAIKVTLLEGSVRVSNKNNLQSLLPGQQALINRDGNIGLEKNADLEHVMAWKNGLFNFNSSDIKTVMRDVARWYDIDVVYQGHSTPDKFGGEITKSANLSQILEILESSRVHFRLEGKKLTVLP